MVDISEVSGVSVSVIAQSLPELADLVYEESAVGVELSPGDEKKIVSHQETVDWVITRIGATDADYSEYYLKIGTKKSPETKEPFGLFNNPQRFEPSLEVPAGVEAGYYAKLDAAAPNSQKYVAKLIGYKK